MGLQREETVEREKRRGKERRRGRGREEEEKRRRKENKKVWNYDYKYGSMEFLWGNLTFSMDCLDFLYGYMFWVVGCKKPNLSMNFCMESRVRVWNPPLRLDS